MFTGIIVDIGVVEPDTLRTSSDVRIVPSRGLPDLREGASIACAGVCLTATRIAKGGFVVDLSRETREKTTASDWEAGRRLNLEYALRAGDPLDGHIVSGHVDSVAEVVTIRRDDAEMRIRLAIPSGLTPLVAVKGSIAVDGVSLTVNDVDRDTFAVTVIPHTARVTTLGDLEEGSKVNLEVDMLARYAHQALATGREPP